MQYLFYLLYLIAIGFGLTVIVLIIELRKHIKAEEKKLSAEEESLKNV